MKLFCCLYSFLLSLTKGLFSSRTFVLRLIFFQNICIESWKYVPNSLKFHAWCYCWCMECVQNSTYYLFHFLQRSTKYIINVKEYTVHCKSFLFWGQNESFDFWTIYPVYNFYWPISEQNRWQSSEKCKPIQAILPYTNSLILILEANIGYSSICLNLFSLSTCMSIIYILYFIPWNNIFMKARQWQF